MRTFLVVLASIATMATMNSAKTQTYLPPVNPGIDMTPGYVAPGYVAPGYPGAGYTVPGFTTPGYAAPGSAAPGYTWREQRANEDWRNNTWREQRFDQDWRNNNWRTERATEDWRQREIYEKQRTPNNSTDRGFVGTGAGYAGECAIGSSEETCRRRGQRANHTKQCRRQRSCRFRWNNSQRGRSSSGSSICWRMPYRRVRRNLSSA